MKKNIIIGLVAIFATVHVYGESIARSTFTYMIERYSDSKVISLPENAEISLACSGEIFKDYAMRYFELIDTLNLNISLINSYDRAKRLVRSHLDDTELFYPRLRENLIAAIRFTLAKQRADGSIPTIPEMTIDKFGKVEMQRSYALCNDPEFIAAIAMQAPLTGSYDEKVEGVVYRIPLVDGEDDFADLIGGSGDKLQPRPVKVKLSLEQWLYEIRKR